MTIGFMVPDHTNHHGPMQIPTAAHVLRRSTESVEPAARGRQGLGSTNVSQGTPHLDNRSKAH
jgi:hypothetical protein